MILYNVTVSIDHDVHEDWVEWMKKTHIPDVMATGHFLESRISKVHGEEEGGLTYAITYVSPSMQTLEEYQEKHAPRLQEEHSKIYGGKFVAFRTLLTVIDEIKK